MNYLIIAIALPFVFWFAMRAGIAARNGWWISQNADPKNPEWVRDWRAKGLNV